MDHQFLKALERIDSASITTPSYVVTGMTAFGIITVNWSEWSRVEDHSPMRGRSLTEQRDMKHGRVK